MKNNCKHFGLLLGLGILIYLIPAALRAQVPQLTVKGTVADSTDKQAMAGVTISLMRMPDSTKTGAVTNEKGYFEIKGLRPGFYILKVTSVGYKPLTRPLRVRQDITLDGLLLDNTGVQLKTVNVEDETPAATVKGDTAQFNAGAFKTNRDATAEDLLRKMPGMEVQGGQVKAQGENVSRVLVDGKPFFDNDPNAVLRNLPSEMVDRVQVFDDPGQQASFSGFTDGQPSRTINIVTRQDRRTGLFGRGTAGYGVQDVYRVDGVLNSFKGPRRLTVLGQSNNINQQNFSIADILSSSGGGGAGGGGGGGRQFLVQAGGGGQGFGGGGGGTFGGGFGAGANVGNFLVGQANGIATTHAGAINFQNDFGKRAKFSGSYFFNQSNNRNDQLTSRTFFTDGISNQVYNDISDNRSIGNTHRLNSQLEFTIDSMRSIIARVRGTLQSNISDIAQNSENGGLGGLINQSVNRPLSSSTGYNVSGDVLYRQRLAKPRRTFSISVAAGANQTISNRDQLSANTYFLPPPLRLDSLLQESRNRQNGWNISGNASYTEPISKYGAAELGYGLTYRYNKGVLETYDRLPSSPDFGLVDSAQSNNLVSTSVTHQPRIAYRWQKEKWQVTARLSYNIAFLSNTQVFPSEGFLRQGFYNVLPSLILQYTPVRGTQYRLFYFTNPNLPSVSQLQQVLDVSNPLQVSTGNPALRQEVNNIIILRYSKFSPTRFSFFNVNLVTTITQNYIASQVQILPNDSTFSNGFVVGRGAQLTTPTNLDGFYNARLFVTYGLPIKKIKSNLNLSLNSTYTRTPGFIGPELNYASNISTGVNITLSSNISEKIDFTLTTNPSVSFVTNTQNRAQNSTYYSFGNTGRLDWRFGKGFLVQPEVTHQAYAGYTGGYNASFVLFNLGIGKKVFAKQQGEIKLYAFDLLGQNNNIRRNVSSAYFEDAQSTVLRRYIMLVFTYTFRNFKAPANSGNPSGGPGMNMQFPGGGSGGPPPLPPN